MTIFTNNKSTKFCQITLHIKRFIHKRKVVFFCLMQTVVYLLTRLHLHRHIWTVSTQLGQQRLGFPNQSLAWLKLLEHWLQW